MKSFLVAGDVGGTNARFALLDADGRRVLQQEVFESQTFPSFEKAFSRFLKGARDKRKMEANDTILAASFGIAGPVVDQRVKTTNLPWVIDAARVSKEFGIGRVTLLNDLVAIGLGALAAAPNKLRSISSGLPRPTGGNVAVIAAGTGLGEALFVWDGATHVPCATEGAHADFAPRNAVQAELWTLLASEYGHVSYERVASGSTISALYTFFVRDQRVPESDACASHVARAADPNRAIVELAVKGVSEAAMRTIDLWCSVYGAEAGNLALSALATSGIYICGGVSAALANVLAEGLPARRKAAGKAAANKLSPFMEAFFDKGRMRPLLEKVPVAICIESLAGLFGAAAHAAAQAAKGEVPKTSPKPAEKPSKKAAKRAVSKKVGPATKRR